MSDVLTHQKKSTNDIVLNLRRNSNASDVRLSSLVETQRRRASSTSSQIKAITTSSDVNVSNITASSSSVSPSSTLSPTTGKSMSSNDDTFFSKEANDTVTSTMKLFGKQDEKYVHPSLKMQSSVSSMVDSEGGYLSAEDDNEYVEYGNDANKPINEMTGNDGESSNIDKASNEVTGRGRSFSGLSSIKSAFKGINLGNSSNGNKKTVEAAWNANTRKSTSDDAESVSEKQGKRLSVDLLFSAFDHDDGDDADNIDLRDTYSDFHTPKTE